MATTSRIHTRDGVGHYMYNDKNLVPEPSVDFYLTAVEKGLGMRSFYASINIL